jgi:hypothetical protein
MDRQTREHVGSGLQSPDRNLSTSLRKEGMPSEQLGK